MKGTTGTNCNTIIVLGKRKARPADCKKCRNGSIMNGEVYCKFSDNCLPVNNKVCSCYEGPYIQWDEVKKGVSKNRKSKNVYKNSKIKYRKSSISKKTSSHPSRKNKKSKSYNIIGKGKNERI